MTALVLPGLEVGAGLWQVRSEADPAANALANRHYPRRNRNGKHISQPGKKLVLVTPCEQAVWCTLWQQQAKTYDKLDVWRCTIFRNEGAGLSSDLIRAAMDLTAQLWQDRPTTEPGWVTWVDAGKVRRKRDPGRCFIKAGWWIDHDWSRGNMIRLRAEIPVKAATPWPLVRSGGGS